MALEIQHRIKRAVANLEKALLQYGKRKKDDDLPFLTVAKAAEVLVEYAWKELKHRVEEEGFLAPTPKEAIRQAGIAGLIENVEDWIKMLSARNDSVHDYFSISEKDYIELTKKFVGIVKASALMKPGR